MALIVLLLMIWLTATGRLGLYLELASAKQTDTKETENK